MNTRALGRFLVLAVLVLGVAAVAQAASQDASRPYDLSGQADQGVRPTAVGLPRIGEQGTLGAMDMALPIIQYHDSGAYERDLDTVGEAAASWVSERAPQVLHPAGPTKSCHNSYRRISRPSGRTALYRRVHVCRVTAAAAAGKPAIVLDIDETSLSNYTFLAAAGFAAASATVTAAALVSDDPPIEPTLALYRYARAHGIAVFFITGRPAAINTLTEANLRSAGYDKGWDGLMNKTSDKGTVAYKSGARAEIEKKGYTIIANVGDQESDLAGGHAEKAFKMPNPFYFISE